MNAERLLAVSSRLLEIESQFGLQSQLQTVIASFQNLANAPANETHQVSAASEVANLEAGLRSAEMALTPGEKSSLEKIGGRPYFSTDLAAGIKASMLAHAMTPAVVRDQATRILVARQQFLENLQQIQQKLTTLGFVPGTLKPFEAELGILFPRELFQDDLPHLAGELKDLAFVIDQFSEAATGSREKIVVGPISTSDPLFFFLLSATTVGALAVAVKKVLDAIKTGLEIRLLFQQSKAAGLSEKDLEPFQALIDRRVEAAIQEAKSQTLALYHGDAGRKNELNNGIVMALRWLAPRIERGLIVEIRQPPPQLRVVGEDATDEQRRAAASQESLFAVSQDLEFPKLAGEPLLQLTNVANDNPGPQGQQK